MLDDQDAAVEPVDFDIIIVGAGPAGSSAAIAASTAGAKVLLIDRADFPRYKTCGGGILGVSESYMPASVRHTIEQRIGRVTLTRDGQSPHTVTRAEPFLGMVQRETFDLAMVDEARRTGTDFRGGVLVKAAGADDRTAWIDTADGRFTSTILIGADGVNSRIARLVGVEVEEVDLGLEVEIEIPAEGAWREEVRLDWSADGAYAWVFPKRDALTVGVIRKRGAGAETKQYLDRWLQQLQLANQPRLHDSGHLTQWRTARSPVLNGRVLVVGDAAGLLEPWTREGISYALRSGTWAGQAAAEAIATNDLSALDAYGRTVADELGPEQSVGAALLRQYTARPGLVDAALRHSKRARKVFIEFCAGERRLTSLRRHRVLAWALRLG